MHDVPTDHAAGGESATGTDGHRRANRANVGCGNRDGRPASMAVGRRRAGLGGVRDRPRELQRLERATAECRRLRLRDYGAVLYDADVPCPRRLDPLDAGDHAPSLRNKRSGVPYDWQDRADDRARGRGARDWGFASRTVAGGWWLVAGDWWIWILPALSRRQDPLRRGFQSSPAPTESI